MVIALLHLITSGIHVIPFLGPPLADGVNFIPSAVVSIERTVVG